MEISGFKAIFFIGEKSNYFPYEGSAEQNPASGKWHILVCRARSDTVGASGRLLLSLVRLSLRNLTINGGSMTTCSDIRQPWCSLATLRQERLDHNVWKRHRVWQPKKSWASDVYSMTFASSSSNFYVEFSCLFLQDIQQQITSIYWFPFPIPFVLNTSRDYWVHSGNAAV